ncbi:MAG: glutamine-hydrolyzing GMP synthase [Candidatus Marinimicrobia bacterium]|nr:glutamine-hydrolyzing GMP synthase [Candidatus Neomarinimicrobiota bacterium]
MHELVLILDFGSQYTQLIARRIREEQVYCRIVHSDITAEAIQEIGAKALVLSGGPNSSFEEGAPQIDPGVFDLGLPILGVCYGLQLIARHYKGNVEPGITREYGPMGIHFPVETPLFEGVSAGSQVWMSHGDHVESIPHEFQVIARSSGELIAGIAHRTQPHYGVQFHPEVNHTVQGQTIISNFLFRIAGFNRDWTSSSFVKDTVQQIRETVGDRRVLLGLSGGVDSSVLAFLMHEAIGDNCLPVFIDNGLLRANEPAEVKALFEASHIKIFQHDYSREFLAELAGVKEPEQKRKIIGRVFIESFEEVARSFENIEYLAQGTLYPDVIESGAVSGHAVMIKSHHNVGGLPEEMTLKIIEPFKELFKDEVRAVGRVLNVPAKIIGRHPFPGPGLAVRCLGGVSKDRLEVLKAADKIFIETLYETDWYDKIWQAFTVLLPLQTVGVMGDKRTYENVLAIRAVHSMDGMTADWVRIPYEILAEVSSKIVNSVSGVNRVVYDITSKPPGTIEWE